MMRHAASSGSAWGEVLRISCVASHAGWAEVGPHIGASFAASLADELRFNVGQSDIVRPLVC